MTATGFVERNLTDEDFAGLPFGHLVRPYVDIGIGLNDPAGHVAQWDRSKWDRPDTGLWSGQEPDWLRTDPCLLYSVSTERGRDRWLDRFGAGTCQVQLNDADGNFQWDGGIPGSQLEVRPGRQVRILAEMLTTGITYPLWQGWLETVVSTFSPDLEPLVQLSSQDAIAQLSHIDYPELPIVGTGELSHDRVNRILDMADWPEDWRDIDVGQVPLQGTNFARALSDELGITADSEGGAAFADARGHIVFKNRTWLFHDEPSTTVQAVIGGDPGNICAAEYVTTRDAGDIVNDVSVGRAGGTAMNFQDPISISLYRRRTFSRTDFISQNDSDVSVIGQRILATRAKSQARLPQLLLRPLTETEFTFCLGVEIGWLIEVRYDPEHGRMTGGQPWSRMMHVQGVNHAFGPSGWETTLRVDDSYANPNSAWDAAEWDRDTWSATV